MAALQRDHAVALRLECMPATRCTNLMQVQAGLRVLDLDVCELPRFNASSTLPLVFCKGGMFNPLNPVPSITFASLATQLKTLVLNDVMVSWRPRVWVIINGRRGIKPT